MHLVSSNESLHVKVRPLVVRGLLALVRMARACVVFVHVPKTGGTSLGGVLRRQYRPTNTIHFSSLDKPLNEFEGIPYGERVRANLVWGHMHFGVDRWLPQPTEYVTVLRDPVARVWSLYNYITREPRHPLHQEVVDSGMTLTEFVESDIDLKQLENGQTRQLSGQQGMEVGREHLDLAIKNLRRCAVVGTTEQFDEGLILMKRAFGWHTPIYLRRNVATDPQVPALASAITMIQERNALDMALYAEALRISVDAIRRQGTSFGREVRRLRKLNRIVSRIASRAKR